MKYLAVIFFSTTFYQGTSQILSRSTHYKSDTTLSWKYIQSGEDKYKAKDYTSALADFKMAVKHNPHSGKAFRLKGSAEHQLELYDSAISSYTKAIVINNEDAISYLGRAESKRFKEDCGNALSDYNKAIELNPKDTDTYFGRGCCEYNLDMHDQCISDFTKYLAVRPNSMIGHFFRGVSYSLTDQNHEAIKDLTKYLRERKNDETPAAYYFRGTSYTSLSDENIANADSAIVDLKKFLTSVPDHPSSYKYLGLAYSVKKDSLMARKSFKQAMVLKPDDGQVYYNWGNLELAWGNYSKAVELYNKALSKEAIKQMNDLYCQSGLARAGLKDTVGALSDFAKSVQIDSNYLQVYQNRIKLIVGKPKYDKIALHDLTKIIWLSGAMNPEDTITVSYLYSQRGMIYARAGNIEAAKADVDKTVSLTPKYFYSYLIRAVVKMILDIKDKTILSDIDKAISLENEKWEPYLIKAYFLEYSEDKSGKKCECVKKAIKLGGSITKEVEDHICKGKHSKDANAIFTFYIDPHSKKADAKKN